MASIERITSNPEILGGKPAIRGTRISVEFVLGLLAAGWTIDDIVGEYPHIARDDIRACRAYTRTGGGSPAGHC